KSLCGMAGIAQVAVVGMPDDYFGEVGAAFVILAPGVELTSDDVEAYAREHLANFKVPRRVIFIEEFPVNATGKVLKNELRARAQALLQTWPSSCSAKRAQTAARRRASSAIS